MTAESLRTITNSRLKDWAKLDNISVTNPVNLDNMATDAELSLKADKTTTVNWHELSSNVIITKSDIWLWNVDDTSDVNKPISISTQSSLNNKADNNSVVHNTWDETIWWIKTFTSSPIIPTPTTDFQPSTKKYVDDVVIWWTPDATTTSKGKIKLAWDLAGTADLPTVLWLANKINSNISITWATKTKITYDAKGLVTSWEDATTSDIADSTDRRYLTDTQKTEATRNSNTSQNWLLSSTDWNTFNWKQPAWSYELITSKDSTWWYAWLTLFKINFKNALNTFTSFFTNSNTAARTYTFPDKDWTVAMTSDIIWDVVWPSSSTDYAIARFDWTTGKLLKNSLALISNGWNISTIWNITSQNYIWSNGTVDYSIYSNWWYTFNWTTKKIFDWISWNELLSFSKITSAVNEFTISNAVTWTWPILEATWWDTNIDININPKWTWVIKIWWTSVGSIYESLSNKSTSVLTDWASDTKYPSVKSVKDYADWLVAGLLDYRWWYDASVNTFPASWGSGTAGAVLKWDMWILSVAGTLWWVAVQIWDSVIANVDTPGQTSGNWNILNSNISYVPEDVANKVTSLSGTSTDIQYPSAKLTYDQLALKVALNWALGTPSSGTVTNLTGTASININGTVGATTPTTGVFTSIASSGVTNDGTSLFSTTQTGTGRAMSIVRNTISATRPVSSILQTHASGGSQASLIIQQADTGEVALGINTDGSLTAFNFKVLDTGATTALSINTPSIVTASGALGITPAAGSGLNINLSTTGDFAVNTDDLFVDTSSGYVGIGTPTPSAPLTVSPSGNATPALTGANMQIIGSNASISALQIDGFDNYSSIFGRRAQGTSTSPSAVISGADIFTIDGYAYGTTGYSASARSRIVYNADETWTDSAQGSSIRFFSTPNTTTTTAEIMRISNNGNVWIGTTNPSTSFEVNKDTGTSFNGVNALVNIYRGVSSGANAWMVLGYYSNGSVVTGWVIKSISNLPLFLWTTNSAQTLTLNDNGNVWIGTTSPLTKIDLNDGTDIGTASINLGTHNTPDTLGGWITWRPNFTGYTKKVAAAIRAVPETSGWFNQALVFFTWNAASQTTSAVERMRISDNGNVGIGTATPGVKLDVKSSNWAIRMLSGSSTDFARIQVGRTASEIEFAVAGTSWQFLNGTIAWDVILRSTAASAKMFIGNGNFAEPSMVLDAAGKIGIWLVTPTAYLHLKAGTATVNTAPIKLTSWVVNTTPEAGTIEFDWTDFFFTI